MKKNLLEDVRAENYFWLKDGGVIKNFRELSEAMSSMSDDTFNYHVNDQKNDFYNWVKDVHGEEDVASGLLKAKTKEEAADYIRRVTIKSIQRAEGNFDCFGTATDYCDQLGCAWRNDCLKH